MRLTCLWTGYHIVHLAYNTQTADASRSAHVTCNRPISLTVYVQPAKKEAPRSSYNKTYRKVTCMLLWMLQLGVKNRLELCSHLCGFQSLRNSEWNFSVTLQFSHTHVRFTVGRVLRELLCHPHAHTHTHTHCMRTHSIPFMRCKSLCKLFFCG